MAIMSYAQNHEDVLLNRLFPESSGGFYIDVGACYPVQGSVTKLFYERGWHGINVEPVPSLSEMLAQDRPRDINLRVGLSNREGIATLYECLTEVGLSTFSEEQVEDLRGKGHEFAEHSIPVMTLARVCEQHADRTIDFLKIDVECHERAVLEGADWSRYRPRVVLVEATRPWTNIPCHDDWEPLLLTADYRFACFDGLNRYYVREEDRQWLPLLAVPVNVLDGYESYEHNLQIQDLLREFEEHRVSLGGTRFSLAVTRAKLDDVQNTLMRLRRAWDDSQVELKGLRSQLEATESQLETTQSQLEATRAQLAPFQELGPIAITVARRLRRLSRQSPRLAAIAKRMIVGVYPRIRARIREA